MLRISLVAAITLCASFLAAHKATRLNIKTGLWRVMTITAAGDDIMLSAGLLEKLTPEQRARVEERMKARQSGLQERTITKQCLTRAELESGVPFRTVGKSCTWTLLSSTRSKVEMRGKCVDQGFKTGATLRIEALSPEEAEGSLQFSSNRENSTPATTSTFKAKWIGPQCRTP